MSNPTEPQPEETNFPHGFAMNLAAHHTVLQDLLSKFESIGMGVTESTIQSYVSNLESRLNSRIAAVEARINEITGTVPSNPTNPSASGSTPNA